MTLIIAERICARSALSDSTREANEQLCMCVYICVHSWDHLWDSTLGRTGSLVDPWSTEEYYKQEEKQEIRSIIAVRSTKTESDSNMKQTDVPTWENYKHKHRDLYVPHAYFSMTKGVPSEPRL